MPTAAPPIDLKRVTKTFGSLTAVAEHGLRDRVYSGLEQIGLQGVENKRCEFQPRLQGARRSRALDPSPAGRACASSPPPAWEVWLSIAIGVAGVFGAVWFAAKVFRIGILMFGKPPDLRTLVRWLRAA